MNYNPQEIEQKWQKFWEKYPETFAIDDKKGKEKKYILDMFPYPSADGLHAGHVESYTATDIVSRYWRMRGKNVLHPQGWDAFGLPAENYAIKTKTHPSITTQKAIVNFKRQMKILGLSYDWSREIDSSNPDYYKWTQWFFLLFYKNGLAYKAKGKVNWCPNCRTVLANEQAEGGVCERCGTQVIQKELEQWFFKITDFIEDKGKTNGLLSGLDKVDWPEHTKIAQKNWIGRSEGTQVKFEIPNTKLQIEVFTTRTDTLFGCTHLVLSPEHPIIENLKSKIHNLKFVEKYIEESKKKTETERLSEVKEKTGVELKGISARNPVNNREIPVFVADYVLSGYGTGAIMAVPAHDQRDMDFAKKYDLPIIEVVRPALPKKELPESAPLVIANGRLKKAYEDEGILINSGRFDGMNSETARERITGWLSKKGEAQKAMHYKLRDWLVSRQRYWGAPIPVIYCEKCGAVPVPEKDLPVELPGDVDFMPTGESPLVRSKKFHDVKCPVCDEKARRESDTMDTFVCSSWYYFRYADPRDNKEFADKEKIKRWLPVDLYVGGAEHTVLHLLYSRFFTKVLHNLGLIDFDEPFLRLRHQGIILAEDGRKMSKSLGNVINPDEVALKYGADSLRLFEMFMGPLEDVKQWDIKGIMGVYRFLEKTWRLKSQIESRQKINSDPEIKKIIHKTIKKVTEDIENLRFNTAIAAMMILVNEFTQKGTAREDFEIFIKILSPFAPHFTEEIWNQLGHKESVFLQSWPEFDEEMLKEETVTLIVQINGKVRARIEVKAGISQKIAQKMALMQENVWKWTAGKKIKKVVFVQDKLINFVI